MTKEQFLQFKEDLKKDIKRTKLQKPFEKEWQNSIFKTEEEYNEAKDKALEEYNELFQSMNRAKNKYGYEYALCNCECFYYHIAYYIAKHRLEGEDKLNYIKECHSKLRINKQNEFPCDESGWGVIRLVNNVLKSYETLICSN